MRRSSRKQKNEPEQKLSYEKKVIRQVLICGALTLGIMLSKNIGLSNGSTVKAWLKDTLSYNTDVNQVIKNVQVFAQNSKLLPAAVSPTPLPSVTPAPTAAASPSPVANKK